MIITEMELMARLKEVEPIPTDVSERAKAVLWAAMTASEDTETSSRNPQGASRGRRRRAPIRGWRPRRLVVAVAGVVALAVGGGIAAAAVLAGNPTPQQAANIYQHWYPDHGAGHIAGTRPTLNAEEVLCDYQGVTSLPADIRDRGTAEGFASNAPLTTPLTAQMLVNACADTDSLGDKALPPSTPATICIVATQGAASDSLPVGWPVIVFGDATCASSGHSPAPTDLLAQVNQRRNLEVAIQAVPQSCPTEAQTLVWVHQQLTRLGARMQIKIFDLGPGGTCWLPVVSWQSPSPGQLPTVQVQATRFPASSLPGRPTTGTTKPTSG